jgi:hypothetical protein
MFDHWIMIAVYDFAIAFHHVIEGLSLTAAVFLICRAWYLRRGRRDKEYIHLLEERIKNDDARLEERNNTITTLEKAVAANETRIAELVLSRYTAELKQGNHERAFLVLEDWFQVERGYIGEVAKRLAEHYGSYGAPEIARDAIKKAQRVAFVAMGCLDNPKEINDLIEELSVFAAEFASGAEDSGRFERALDILHDFAGSRSMDELLPRIMASAAVARSQLEEGRYQLATLFAQRGLDLATRVLPIEHQLRLSTARTLAECLSLSSSLAN